MVYSKIEYLTKNDSRVMLVMVRKYGGDCLYQVGDHIVYPMHGAGMIKAVEEREFQGEKQDYYIIKMVIGNMEVMIPASKMLNSSIRHVTDLASLKKMVNKFQHNESEELLPWKQRHKANMDKIKTGKLKACAEVIRDLISLKREDKLNSSEKRMLNKAREFLVSELKLVEGITESQMKRFLLKLKQDKVSIS